MPKAKTALYLITRLLAMRIDVYLAENGIVASRTEAKRFIDEGAVMVDGKVVNKPSFDVTGKEDKIYVDISVKKYVSRGGLKLKGALDEFCIDVVDKLCLDIGASSGGFTDCLLKEGARHVIAVDSGTDQIVASLRNDDRVTVLEGYNARYMSVDDFAYVPQLAVMDVSFISATLIIPAVYNVLADGADFICLIKPQFEVGRSGIGKGGIVKDSKIRDAAVNGVVNFAENRGFLLKSLIVSPIKGGDGNIEFLAHFKKEKGEDDDE